MLKIKFWLIQFNTKLSFDSGMLVNNIFHRCKINFLKIRLDYLEYLKRKITNDKYRLFIQTL